MLESLTAELVLICYVLLCCICALSASAAGVVARAESKGEGTAGHNEQNTGCRFGNDIMLYHSTATAASTASSTMQCNSSATHLLGTPCTNTALLLNGLPVMPAVLQTWMPTWLSGLTRCEYMQHQAALAEHNIRYCVSQTAGERQIFWRALVSCTWVVMLLLHTSPAGAL